VKSVLTVQAILGVGSFLFGYWQGSIHLEHISNTAIPLMGLHAMRFDHGDGWKTIRLCGGYQALGLVYRILHFFLTFSLFTLPGTLISCFIFGIQLLAMGRYWMALKVKNHKDAYFYLNMLIMNKEDVVQRKVDEKLGQKLGHGKLRSKLGGLAGHIANKKMTDAKFVEKMGGALVQKMPEQMLEKGIHVRVDKRFQYDNFMTLQVTIEHVDVARLIAEKKGEDAAAKLDKYLHMLPAALQKEVDALLSMKIADGLLAKLPTQMAEKMKEEQGLEVSIETKAREDQADFLFEMLDELSSPPDGAAAAGTMDDSTVGSDKWYPGKHLKERFGKH